MAISFVDLAKRSLAPAELRRFSAGHGARALLDEDGKAFRKAGLGYLSMDDDEILERLLVDQRLLRLPLVRNGNVVTVGVDAETWRSWQPRV